VVCGVCGQKGHLVTAVSQPVPVINVRRSPALCEANHPNGRVICQAIIRRIFTAEFLIQWLVGLLLFDSQ